MLTMSSACESSLAKISVFGTSVRSGNVSFSTLSRNVWTIRRIWSMATTFRSRSAAVVGDVLVRRLPARLPRLPVAVADHRPRRGLDGGARGGDLRANAVDLVVAVDAVGDRLRVRVLHHDVLVEEAVGVLGRRGREADQVGVEVLQHLAPERVDGPVALVDEDDVEELGRHGGVVDDRQRLLRRVGPSSRSACALRPRGRAPARPSESSRAAGSWR